MTLLWGGPVPSPKRSIFARAADRLSPGNMKKFLFAERVFKGQGPEIDVEELLLDTEGDVDFYTENFNPFGDREEDFNESLRPVEAVEAWEKIKSVDKMRTPRNRSPGELSVYLMGGDLRYEMHFVHGKDFYKRGGMQGVLESDVEKEKIESICRRYGIESSMSGWNREFDDKDDLGDYTDLLEESYRVGIEQLQEGIMSAEIRDVRYLDSDYDHLEDEELMSVLLGEAMIPEKIEVSEHRRDGSRVHYDVRVWDYETVGEPDLEITLADGEELLEPEGNGEIYEPEPETEAA